MKTVIISHSGIGNLIMTTPCAKALWELGHEVVICTWPRSFRILEGYGWANVTIGHPVIESMTADNVIVSACGAIWQDEWTKGKVWRAGPDSIPWVQHEVEYYMDVARELGYCFDTPEPESYIDDFNKDIATGFLRKNNIEEFFCINASYLKSDHWGLKNWGNQKYSLLLSRLHAEYPHHKFVFVGDESDYRDAEDIFNQSGCVPRSAFFNLCGGSDDIKYTAAIISESRCIIGNDGGLMHIAATTETPTVTVFTFTNPIKNRPFHTNPQLGREVMVPCDKRPECQHGKFDRCKKNGCFDLNVSTVRLAVHDLLD